MSQDSWGGGVEDRRRRAGEVGVTAANDQSAQLIAARRSRAAVMYSALAQRDGNKNWPDAPQI